MRMKIGGRWRASSHVAAAAVVVAVAAVSYWVREISLKDLVLAVLPLLTTFMGAAYAFRLNESRLERDEAEQRRGALNRALFLVIRQANAIHQVFGELSKYPTDHQLAFVCPAVAFPAYEDLVLDFGELAFLIDSDPQLLMHLSIEQERFFQALSSWRIRNQWYVDRVQPALNRCGLMARTVSAHELRGALHEVIYEGALNGAKTARFHVTKLHASLPMRHAELHTVAKRLFPHHRFISFERSEAAIQEGGLAP